MKLACLLGVLALLAGTLHAYRVHLKCKRIVAGLTNQTVEFDGNPLGWCPVYGEWGDEYAYLASHPFLAKPFLLRKLAETNAFIAAHVALTRGAYSGGWSAFPDWNNYLPGESNDFEQCCYLNRLWRMDGRPFRANPVYTRAYRSEYGRD